MRIDVHFHGGAELGEVKLERLLDFLKGMEARIMARFDTVQLLQTAINDATNAVAKKIQLLIDKINSTAGEGLDGPQTESLIGWLEALRDQQLAMGATPTEPIPVTPLPEPAMPGSTL